MSLKYENNENSIIANIKNGFNDQTIYLNMSILEKKILPLPTILKKNEIKINIPIKIIGNTLFIDKKLLEIGIFYPFKMNGEELLVLKTASGIIQIFEVLESE